MNDDAETVQQQNNGAAVDASVEDIDAVASTRRTDTKG